MKFVEVVLASIASTVALASAPSTASNASAPSVQSSSHANHTEGIKCVQPAGGFGGWWYNSGADGPYGCYGDPDRSWSMLNAYRAGGKVDVHWKYTDDPNDFHCLSDWEYYAEDGTTLIATIRGRTSVDRDGRRWCALPVYRSGGLNGYQWGFCICHSQGRH